VSSFVPNLGSDWEEMGCLRGRGHGFGGSVGCRFWPSYIRLDKKRPMGGFGPALEILLLVYVVEYFLLVLLYSTCIP
jgi:hypothetical protein